MRHAKAALMEAFAVMGTKGCSTGSCALVCITSKHDNVIVGIGLGPFFFIEAFQKTLLQATK